MQDISTNPLPPNTPETRILAEIDWTDISPMNCHCTATRGRLTIGWFINFNQLLARYSSIMGLPAQLLFNYWTLALYPTLPGSSYCIQSTLFETKKSHQPIFWVGQFIRNFICRSGDLSLNLIYCIQSTLFETKNCISQFSWVGSSSQEPYSHSYLIHPLQLKPKIAIAKFPNWLLCKISLQTHSLQIPPRLEFWQKLAGRISRLWTAIALPHVAVWPLVDLSTSLSCWQGIQALWDYRLSLF